MNFVTLVLLIAPFAPISAQSPGESPPLHVHPVLRLQPTAFAELPKRLVAELQRRGCTIPQPYTDRKANVIRGQFLKPGQTDWAVLCSKPGSTSLLLFWNGSATNSTALAKNPGNAERIDWFIRPVDRKFIIDCYRAFGGPKPPPIDHQGIEFGGDSASEVLYYYGGKWLKLQGED